MLGFTGSREWVYPLKIAGRFTRYHKFSSALLFAFLIVVPWIRINGSPVFLADVPSRRLYALGQIYTASDGVLIMLFALAAAFSLFMFTSIFGRLWCGYFCPQSVFMINLVFPIEEWLEGSRSKRMRADKKPEWTFDRIWRRGAKWAIYLVIAVFVSMSFMGFFVDASTLWTGGASYASYGIVGAFSFIWFWDFAWYREQVCNYICPYARFQGALTDDESLVISYDTDRGEPRGRAAKERGGCIDCNKCVAVCPQGIDIRDGFQLECIACGRCIDACESVMDRLGHDTLVRYSTIAKDEGKEQRWLRPRTMAYGALLTVLASAIVFVLGTHQPVEVMVSRAPGALFVEDADGYVRNTFMMGLTDRDAAEGTRTYAIAVEGLPEGSHIRAQPVQLTTSQHKKVPLIVRVPADKSQNTLPITVKVRGADLEISHDLTFKGPDASAAAGM